MTAGGPQDHPLTDLLHWNLHPFPPEIEQLVLAIAAITPEALHETKLPQADWWAWAQGRNVQQGVQLLSAKLAQLRG